ncbi:46 kDa FK506-binding nuclear protein-like isoform X4 [Patiria miniata]|uniref:peptidylprolyl isomerase n=1 Tax=Patiria miniata TaxID=46514 RepID=A0A914AZF7_PATMI|nr:46 kDa FK506-binding nuclear protein-like isoform X4 [Patiria miniata]
MFWGLTIEPGKHYTQTVEESFHVSMVALDTRDVAITEREQGKLTQLMVQHEKAEFLVCTLCYGTVFQQSLDLNLTEGEEVTFFTEGRGTLHLTGYLVKDEPLTLDPDMMSLEEMSSSDDVASDSGDEDEMSEVVAGDDDDDDEVPSLQELAAASLEDEDDDNEDDEWKPKDKKTKRKKKQKKKDSKRLHLEEADPEPRKAKQLATLEMSKIQGDGSDSDEGTDEDFNPMDVALQDKDEDMESDSDDDLLEWEDEEDDSDEEDGDSEDSEDEDELYDEQDSDYNQDSEEEDVEVVVRSLRNKQHSKQQLREKMAGDTVKTVKSPRILRAREIQSPKVSPAKSPDKQTTAENKENIAGQQRLRKDLSTPKTAKPKGNKTPSSKTPTEGKAAKSKTPSSELVGRKTPGRKTSDGSTEKGQTPQGQTPRGQTPTAKTPTVGRGGHVDQEGKSPKQKMQANQTPKSLKKDKKKDQQATKTPKKVKLPGGTVIEDIVTGDGKVAKVGKMVHVYYKGTLASNGKQFDSCLGGKPFMFRLGRSEVIKGWDMGIAGMKLGGERRITIPAAEGYGRKAVGPIPPNSTLVFNVTLKNVS